VHTAIYALSDLFTPLLFRYESVLETAKEREGEQPPEVYLNIMKKVGENMKKQAVHAPRDLKKLKMRN
jgi:hypothetical protein